MASDDTSQKAADSHNTGDGLKKNTNQQGRYDFDLAVIGAGPGGYATALRAAELGLSVALIDKDSSLGGTCLNRGCIPTKALLTAAHTWDEIKHAKYWGISVNQDAVQIDTAQLHRQKMKTVETMVKGLTSLVTTRGITVFHRYASLTTNHEISLGANDSSSSPSPDHTDYISADQIVLALGAAPIPFPSVPFSETVMDSNRALSLQEIPSSVAIIGSGAVALEFASFWNSLGSQVTVFVRKDRPLSHGDSHMSSAVMRGLKRVGIRFLTHTTVSTIQPNHSQDGSSQQSSAGALVFYKKAGKEEEETLEAEKVLVAIGRRPATEAPWLKKIGLDRDKDGFISTDSYGQTTVSNLWAVGDIRRGHQLAHRAFSQGIIAAEAIAYRKGLYPALPQALDEFTVPQVVYSTIEAASVGYTADQAVKAANELSPASPLFCDIEETILPLLSNSRVLMEQSSGSITLVTARRVSDPEQTTILIGAHIAGPRASELIAEAEQIIGNRIPLSQAASLIHPHPTLSEALGEALLKADGRPLHVR